MKVRELMTTDAACCTSDTSIREAARMMVDCDCGAIPVVEESAGRLIGVITDRDITCRGVAAGRDPGSTQVRAVMTSNVVAIEPEASLEEAIRKMERAQVRRIPVVDDEGRCIGILSQADIATHTSEHETAELLSALSQPTSSSHRHA